MIDPSVGPEVYMGLAKRHGCRIRWVFETHIHADHLSRARQLAEQSEARLSRLLRTVGGFHSLPWQMGNSSRIGEATLTAMRTPGHTDEEHVVSPGRSRCVEWATRSLSMA